MPGALLWGWDNTNKVWIPLQVDANGYVKVDMSNINLDDLANVSVAAPADDDLFYYDSATSLWKSRKLVDADIPAGIARDAEVTADIATHAALETGVHGVGSNYIPQAPAADHVLRTFTKGWTAGKYLKGAGVDTNPTERSYSEVLTDLAISGIKYYETDSQMVQHNAITCIYLGDQAHDIGSHFNNNTVTGTADATSANQLKDTGQFTEAEAYYLGMHVYNTTDHTYAKVTGKTDNDTLDIDTDIMANGESYRIYHSKFVCPYPGYYLASAGIRYANTVAYKYYAIIVLVNGDTTKRVTGATYHSSFAGVFAPTGVGVWDCAANDTLELYAWQNSGAVDEVEDPSSLTLTNLCVQLLGVHT